MYYRKILRELLNFDYIIMLLSVVALFIYTTLFVVITSQYRYLFLLFIAYTIFTLFISMNSTLNYYKLSKIKRNNKCRVNLKLFNTRIRKVKKVIE